MRHPRLCLIAAACLAGTLSTAQASDVTIPNTFVAGTTAVAAEVNANFTALATGVNDNNTRIQQLENTVQALQDQLAALTTRVETLETDLAAAQSAQSSANAAISAIQANSVLDLDGYLTLDTSGTYETARFDGVNVQIVNGSGQEDLINGLGNLIVGYDDPTTGLGAAWCSNPALASQLFCESGGAVWAESQKSGSHNLIVGNRNSYTGYGGAVFGENNVINANGATVLGGAANMARYQAATIVGGTLNRAVSYTGAVIVGGYNNLTNGSYAAILGGEGNIANGSRSAVVGGNGNVTGASATRAVVSGGSGRTASGNDDWVAGSLFEDQ